MINRRHSRDRFFPSDNGEKDGSLSNSIAAFDRGGISGTNYSGNNSNESLISGMVMVHGCSNTEVVKILSDRWAAAMQSYNDPSLDATERPVIYKSPGGSSGWGSSTLAYQSSVMDFLAEMGHAVRRANINQVHLSTVPK